MSRLVSAVREVQEVARQLPLDRLVLESGATTSDLGGQFSLPVDVAQVVKRDRQWIARTCDTSRVGSFSHRNS